MRLFDLFKLWPFNEFWPFDVAPDVSIRVSGPGFGEGIVTARLPRWPGRLLLANGYYVEDLLLDHRVAVEQGVTILMKPNPESDESELVHLGVGSVRDVVLEQWGSDRNLPGGYLKADLGFPSGESQPVAWPEGSRIGFVGFAPSLRNPAHFAHVHRFLHELLRSSSQCTVTSAEPELLEMSEQDTRHAKSFCGFLFYLLDRDQVAVHCPALDDTGAINRLRRSRLLEP